MNEYVYLRVNYGAPRQATNVVTRAVDPFEAELVTTNLLAGSPDKEREARAAFERLAARKPDDVALLEARADFELRHGRVADALPHLARAVDAGSTNVGVYRDYAAIDPSKADAVLARAFALAPSDLDIRVRYASALMRQRKAAETLALLAEVKPVPPDSALRVYQLQANAYMQLDRFAEAQAAAAHMVAAAKPGSEAASADRLSKSIDDFVLRRILSSTADR